MSRLQDNNTIQNSVNIADNNIKRNSYGFVNDNQIIHTMYHVLSRCIEYIDIFDDGRLSKLNTLITIVNECN